MRTHIADRGDVALQSCSDSRLQVSLLSTSLKSHVIKSLNLIGLSLLAIHSDQRERGHTYQANLIADIWSISYPESSGFLVSGWAPWETLGNWKKFKFFDWLLRNGLRMHCFTAEILRLLKFQFPRSRVSPGVHPLTKKPEDSDTGDFIRRSRRSAKITIAAQGILDDFRRSHWKYPYPTVAFKLICCLLLSSVSRWVFVF